MTILPATRFRLAALTVRETGAITAADLKRFPFTPAGAPVTIAGAALIAGFGSKMLKGKHPARAALIGGGAATVAILSQFVWKFLGERSAPTS